MYERFTDRARKVMQLANHEALRFQHQYIGTEHMLLGLIKEGSGVAAHVLKNLDIGLREVRLAVEKLVVSGTEEVTMGKLPQNPDAKKAIHLSMETARQLNHNYVGTEHLLLALLKTECTAQNVLESLGVSAEDAKESVLSLLGHGQRDPSDGSSAPARKVTWHDPQAALVHSRTASFVERVKSGCLPPSRGPWQLQNLITALSRSWRNSVLLVGDPGVGKRALVEKLAVEIANAQDSVINACGKDIVEISFLEGASIKQTLMCAENKNLFFFEDIHLFMDPAAADLSLMPFPAWLNAALAQGTRCIATTTPTHLELFDAHEEVAARFEKIAIGPAEKKQVLSIVNARKDGYEQNHQVRLTDEAVEEAFELAERYGDVLYPLHAQPASSLDVIENAAAFEGWKKSRSGGTATSELHTHNVAQSVAMRLGKDIDDVKNRK